MRFIFPLFLIILSVTACRAEPSNDKLVDTGVQIKTETVAAGLDHPWAVEFLPGGEFLVTERPGILYRISSDGTKTEIKNTPDVYNRGQGGLLDIALEGNEIYLSYAGADTNDPDLANTEVLRATLNLETNSLENPRVIFKASPKVKGDNHWGSRLLVDGEYLYVTLGERFDYRDQAQDPQNNLGTFVRIYKDGTIPDDNPFNNSVYSYGHRNIQGMAQHPETGAIWIHEHGPKGGDEINIIEPGANYGWPEVSYGRRYSGAVISETGEHAPDFKGPVLHWTPSIAPSGMVFYTGTDFPEWNGDVLVGALVKQHLRRVKLDGTRVIEQEVLLDNPGARIRDVAQSPDGALYVLTDASDGRLIRLTK